MYLNNDQLWGKLIKLKGYKVCAWEREISRYNMPILGRIINWINLPKDRRKNRCFPVAPFNYKEDYYYKV